MYMYNWLGLPRWQSGKEPACQCRRRGLDSRVGKIPLREGNGSPFQYSCLENPMDTGAWWATVHRVAMSWTQLKQSKQASKQARITWRFYLSEDANLVGLAGLLGDAVATGPSTYHSTPDRS